MNNKKLFIIIFSFILLFNLITAKADSKDVMAKYEFIKSSQSFEYVLNGNGNINELELNIKNNSSDNGIHMVIIPLSESELGENYTEISEDYEGYYVDFYDSNNNQVTLSSPVTVSSISGKSYDNALISVKSTSKVTLYESEINNNTFSFEVSGKSYVIFDFDVSRKGDVNIDHLININDLVLLRKHLAEIKLLSGKGLRLADVNSNEVVNINDLIKLRKYLAGLEEL